MNLIFTNTRAELIKLSPLINLMKDQEINYEIIATGQHNLDELSKSLDIKINKYIIPPPKESSRFGLSKLKAIFWIYKVICKTFDYILMHKSNSKLIIVHGDTLSSAIVSFVSFILKEKVVHIEAGLRSKNLFNPFPEEIMRRIICKFSKIHFVPDKQSYNNLIKAKGEKYIVGNTIYDLINSYNIEPSEEEYAIAVIHRHENLTNKKRMKQIINTINYCNKKVFLFAHHPLLKSINNFGLKLNSNVIIKSLKNHKKFIEYLANSSFVIADGGSIMEECKFYNKPYIMMREETERKNLYPTLFASKKILEVLNGKE